MMQVGYPYPVRSHIIELKYKKCISHPTVFTVMSSTMMYPLIVSKSSILHVSFVARNKGLTC